MLASGTFSATILISITSGDTVSSISHCYVAVSPRKRAEAQFAALRKPAAPGLPPKRADSIALAGEAASKAAFARRAPRRLTPHTLSLRPGG